MTTLEAIAPKTMKEWLDMDGAIMVDVGDEIASDAEHNPHAILQPLPTLDPATIKEFCEPKTKGASYLKKSITGLYG